MQPNLPFLSVATNVNPNLMVSRNGRSGKKDARPLLPVNEVMIRAGHRKFKLNSEKLQEVFRNRKCTSAKYLLLFCPRDDLFYF